jgi:AraC-like DNA-binding protein
MAEDRRQQLAALVEGSLRLTSIEGAVSQVPARYTTGWRMLPFAVVAQWRHQPVRFACVGHPARVVPAGHCLLTPPGVRHCVTVIGAGEAESRWAHVQALVLGVHDLFTQLDLPMAVAPPAADGLGETCAALAGLRPAGRELSLVTLARRQELHGRLIGQLAVLTGARTLWEGTMQRADRILPALAHIDAHWADPLDSTRLARLAGLSRSRFHAVFTAAMGCAPMAYVRRRRCAEAQRLLVSTGDAIAGIGARVGYPDPFHFSRIYKATTGASPQAFRRMAREEWAGEGLR